MEVAIIIIISVIGFAAFVAILIWHFHSDRYTPLITHVPDYKGLCLFDIDGTLTTGTENEKVVQYCIDKGYAVGIATAGAMYNPGNLMNFEWMPRNLYEFMSNNNFDTFNNVASGVLQGIHNSAVYTKTLRDKPPHIFWPGWFKGIALESTGRAYGIKDPHNLILFDNDPSFISGVNQYNSDLRVVCAGMPCNGTLSVDTLKQMII